MPSRLTRFKNLHNEPTRLYKFQTPKIHNHKGKTEQKFPHPESLSLFRRCQS